MLPNALKQKLSGPGGRRFFLVRKAGQRDFSDRLAVEFARLLMAELAVSEEELASRCGLDLRSMRNELAAGVPSIRARYAIEAALGFRAIWSTGVEVNLRARAVELLGCDPRLGRLSKVMGLCRKHGIGRPSVRRQEAWADQILAWVAAHPGNDSKVTH